MILFDLIANLDNRALIVIRARVAAGEANQFVFLDVLAVLDDDLRAVDLDHFAVDIRDDARTRVQDDALFDARTDHRRVSPDQWHSLRLHVAAHQSAVRVVVLEERNQAGADRHDLLWRDIHELALVAGDDERVTLATRHDLTRQAVAAVKLSVGLSDGVLVFLVGRHIDDLIGDNTLVHFAVRRFDEPQGIDLGETGEARDQTDVCAFWRFNRADAGVMRAVNVADIKARPFAGQTAGPQC